MIMKTFLSCQKVEEEEGGEDEVAVEYKKKNIHKQIARICKCKTNTCDLSQFETHCGVTELHKCYM